MNDTEFEIKRIKDLAQASYTQNRYTFTKFLSADELTLVDQIKSELKHVDYSTFGGHEICERQVMRFGSLETLGYEEAFPITTLLIEPLIDKFSDTLTHRDYLGAMMNLGIKREVLGDILIKDKRAYVFCLDEIADYICSELTRIKHTSVKISKITGDIPELEKKLEDFEVLVTSPRIDAVVAALTKLSRSQAAFLFREKRVLVNNRTCENNSMMLKESCTLSIRGYGKFVFLGEGGRTKKDRVFVKMQRYYP